jgi:hypothetical protein
MTKPEPMEKMEIEGLIQNAVSDAVDFIESEIATDRIKAQRYFDGEVDIGEEEGRSRVVATKVRDTVRNIKPSLMRVFLNTAKPVEFIPRGPEDVLAAQQATEYMHWVFNEVGGYRILNDAFHDALVKKVGVLKVYWDTYTDVETYTYTNITEPEYLAIVNEDDVEVLEHSVEQEGEMEMEDGMMMDMDMSMPRHSMKINRKCESGKLMVESVPPEEFMIDRNARSIDDFYVVAHRTEMRVADVVAMGFDYEEVVELDGIGSSDTYSEAEDFERRGYQMDDEEDTADPSMRLVAITEAYMRMDIDGTGDAQMYRFILGGSNYKLLDYEPWGEIPFAIFEIDPEPHAFFGRSIPDLIMNDQDAATAMLRGVLDNVALTNNPRIGFVEGQVNSDDLLNNEIGGIIRMKSAGMIQEVSVPFIAGQTLPAVQYMDQAIEAKTGVSRASMGLDPDALQNTTATAAQLTAQGGAAQIEVMARNLAEGGMRRLFKLMLQLYVENSPEPQLMRMNSEFVPVDPRVWNTSMDVSVNVGLGTGQEENKMAALQQALQLQMQIWQAYGPQNGLVSMSLIRNTLADIMALGGIRNADRYFMPMNPMVEQQLIAQQQAMAAQNQQPDPNTALAQAQIQVEQIKAQSKAQSDLLNAQIRAQEAIAKDDRERDKMDQDLVLTAAKILGDYGIRVNEQQIKQMQNTPRYPNQAPEQAVMGGRF